jgi:hypothetical protein
MMGKPCFEMHSPKLGQKILIHADGRVEADGFELPDDMVIINRIPLLVDAALRRNPDGDKT